MKVVRSALLIFIWLTVLTGVLYPAIVTGIAQVAFPHQANGSVIVRDGKAIGSELIGQQFDNPRYFWGRPSAINYDASSSSGSNLGPTNPDLIKAVKERVGKIRAAHPDQTGPVPVDLVTTSGSGLDPHISPAAADYQLARVANVRGIDASRVRQLIADHISGRTFGVLGEPRVNVLQLNLALETLR